MNTNYLSTLTERLSKMEREVRHIRTNAPFVNDDIIKSRNIQNQISQLTKQIKQMPKSKIPKMPTPINVNKLVFFNKNNQLTPTNLSSWITCSNDEIKITDRGDGGIIIDSYKKNITDNTEIEKEIIVPRETKVEDIIKIGDCNLVIGKNNLLKLNIDDNGTVSMMTANQRGDLNELDLYSERMNFLSNVNSTSPSSGSVVMYGGVGIIKDLCIGGSLVLPTKVGIQTKLDYYEEGTLNVVWTGIWGGSIDASYIYQRIGHLVTLCIPYTTNKTTESGVITNTQETYLPKRLRPNYDMKYTMDGQDDGKSIQIQVCIYGDDGRIKIYPKNGKIFSGTGISGFDTFCVSYMTELTSSN